MVCKTCFDYAVIVTVVPVRMMEVTLHQVVRMITVWNCFVPQLGLSLANYKTDHHPSV